MARNVAHMDALVVCAMDARRSQIYNALFTSEHGRLTRRTPDRAIGLSELAEEFDPPVTKSCLNHRLRKLVELAKPKMDSEAEETET